MKDSFRFSKWHGLGNHFIVSVVKSTVVEQFTTKQIQKLCDPHFGIGSDGLMLVSDSLEVDHSRHVWMYNPDGSPMGMCGNGIRCVFGHTIRYIEPSDEITFTVEERRIKVRSSNFDTSHLATVDMGTASVNSEEVIQIGGRSFKGYFVDIGNPHFIIPVEALPSNEELYDIGPQLENHSRFINRANIEFAKKTSSNSVDVIVWERGAGKTLACGTGACATAAAFFQFQNLSSKSTIQLPGGPLDIEVLKDSILMTGPAIEVFKGEYQWQ